MPPQSFHARFRRSPTGDPSLGSPECTLSGTPSSSSEVVDGRDLIELPAEAPQVELGPRLQTLRGRGDLPIFDVAFGGEHRLQLCLSDAFDELGGTEGGLSAIVHNFPKQPAKVFQGLRPGGQDIHRVLEGNGADSLEAAADLHPEVVWLGWNLMHQEEPTALPSTVLDRYS